MSDRMLEYLTLYVLAIVVFLVGASIIRAALT